VTSENYKRSRCERCSRPESVCLCSFIEKIDNGIAVSIYRHPSEIKKAVGTAALTALCLNNCRIVDGEHVVLPTPRHRTQQLLLFPPMESPSTGLADVALIDASSVLKIYNIEQVELVVIDGSWKKARKMYYQSADLQGLDKITLDMAQQQARYTIRKAEKPGQLSTLEAIAAALGQIEHNNDKYQPLHSLQQLMVEKQLASMNDSVRQRYR